MQNGKKWSIGFLALTLVLMAAAGTVVGVIDPFFHYHAPLENLQYPLVSQRYQNDGIVKHFDYDALITGSSVTENFSNSEMDALFGVNSVKVSYSGANYQEVTAILQQALEYNPEIRYVLYGIDEWFLFAGRELILADGDFPTYLYDKNPINDVKYLLNKEILLSNALEVLRYTAQGNTTTSFDDYGRWEYPTGAEYVLERYQRPEKVQETARVTPEMEATLRENIRVNLVRLAQEHPDTQFLYFFPPYSIVNWDMHSQDGTLAQIVEGMRLTAQELVQEENVQVFSFHDDFELITDLNQYKDPVHYASYINSLLLQRMHRGEYRLTEENNDGHWQKVLEFYQSYDYESIFQ